MCPTSSPKPPNSPLLPKRRTISTDVHGVDELLRSHRQTLASLTSHVDFRTDLTIEEVNFEDPLHARQPRSYSVASCVTDAIDRDGSRLAEYSSYRNIQAEQYLRGTIESRLCDITSYYERNAPYLFTSRGRIAGWKRRPQIIIRGGSGSLFAHELCGHFFQLHRNDCLNRGARLTTDRISICDDPTLFDHAGYYPFDNFGTPSERVDLARDGIVVGALTVRSNKGFRATAHARRQDATYACEARPSTTIIEPTEGSGEGIVPEPGDVVIEKFRAGGLNHRTQRFRLLTECAWFKTRRDGPMPLRPFVFEGFVPTVLSNIVSVGRVVSFLSSMCKGSSGVLPVAHGTPDILIAGMSLT